MEEIEIILLKYFKGDTTLGEEEFLEEWILNNRQEYAEAVKVYFSTLELKHPIDTDLAYQKFIEKTNETKIISISKTKVFSRILKYVAVFVGIAISSFLWYQNGYKQNLVVSQAKNRAYDKATLVLADGTEVDLEEHQNEEIKAVAGAKIVNKTKVLKFSSLANAITINSGEITYNTLYVPNGGIYQIELPDGTSVWLNSATSLKFPTQFVGKERVVSVEGEAYFEVKKDKKKPFIVQTKTANVTVLGTHFNVSSYGDDDFFSTTLLEGSVQLSALNQGIVNVILKPGQKGSLVKGNNSSIGVDVVDVYQEVAWKEGNSF